MAACKAGKAGTIVAPAEIIEAQEADNADPVEVNKLKVEQRELKTGKYGKQEIKTFKPEEAKDGEEKEKTWIALKLKDKESGEPIAGEAYEVKLADGSLATGTLDEKGEAKVDGIDPGNCEVTYPNLHEKKWDKTA